MPRLSLSIQGAPGGSVGAPVDLPLPPVEPTPVPGCTACAEAAARRRDARRRGDHSGVSDANVALRSHDHTAS